jgi:hypothetical protein
VSFAAIILCVASQRVFIVVRVKCDPRFSVISEIYDLEKQHVCMKFCFQLGKTASETQKMIKTAFGDSATEAIEWFSRFKRWKISMEDSES